MNLLIGPGSPLRGTIGQTLSANRNQLAKAGIGLGLMGLGKATGSGILGGLGGSLAGNAAGNITGAVAGNGFMPSTGLGGFGGTLGTGLGSMAGFSYANKKDPVERPPSFIDSLRAKFSADISIKEAAQYGYNDALKKFGFASMLGSMAGAFAGPAARAGLGKVAPRIAGKLNGPIRSGIFDTAVGSAASSLASPSDKTAALNQTENQYQLDPTIKDIPPWALQAAQVANPLIHNKRMYR